MRFVRMMFAMCRLGRCGGRYARACEAGQHSVESLHIDIPKAASDKTHSRCTALFIWLRDGISKWVMKNYDYP